MHDKLAMGWFGANHVKLKKFVKITKKNLFIKSNSPHENLLFIYKYLKTLLRHFFSAHHVFAWNIWTDEVHGLNKNQCGGDGIVMQTLSLCWFSSFELRFVCMIFSREIHSFGVEDFRNEILWHRHRSYGTGKLLPI